MSKPINCIKLLRILDNNKNIRIPAKDLAEKLDTNVRNITEYCKELQEVGYQFDNTPGLEGGYMLKKDNVLPELKLLAKDQSILLDEYEYILSKNDFERKKDYRTGMGKIFASIPEENSKPINNNYGAAKNPSLDDKERNMRYNIIGKAIKEHRAIKLVYKRYKDGPIVRVMHPYALKNIKNGFKFDAYVPEIDKIYSYDLDRIDDWVLLDETFEVKPEYNPEENNNQGYGNLIKIVLIANQQATNRLLTMKDLEKAYEKIDSHQYQFTIMKEDTDSLVSFLLSFGSNIKVVEPIDLAKRLKKKAMDAYSNYLS